MPRTLHRAATQLRSTRRVRPSIVDRSTAAPFTLEQELTPFGSWVGDPIWVPPKDSSQVLAETMLQATRPFSSRAKRWDAVVKKHRGDFTQVREFDLFQASIRLPQGKFFVTVTEQKNFDKITDTIPNCVQTRLEEFLSSPAMQQGAKVYYLKPLCVELGDELMLTTGEDLTAAINKIQAEVFATYQRLALYRRPLQAVTAAIDLGLALPRSVVNYAVARKQKAIDELQARLEFQRRKLALRAAKTYGKLRSDGCTFDEMLELTSPLNRLDVIEQYGIEQDLSQSQRARLMQIDVGNIPWFLALSLTASFLSALTISAAPPVVVCDPAFVAEMPGARGVLLKIGHFDEVGGVTHVEL